MRGRIGGAAVAGSLLMLMVAGCMPARMDGGLTAAWASFPEPTPMLPVVGECFLTDYTPTRQLSFYTSPVDCTSPNLLEVGHVGTFTGEAAARDTPPAQGTPAWREAYAECEREVADYLGADFRYGRLWLGVAVPTDAAWGGGARWFRCDLLEQRQPLDRTYWPDSLRGALAAGPSDLTLNCFTATVEDSGDVSDMDPVPCSEPHQAEFVGVWRSNQVSYPETDRQFDQVHRGCRQVVAEFTDSPQATVGNLSLGTIFSGMDEEDWDNGDRGVRCYLYSEEDLTGSLAGVGPNG